MECDGVSLLEELLPCIPNDVTLRHIVSKLPWKAIPVLSLVSTSWQKAIQSRMVYDARVRSSSTETLLVIAYDDAETSETGKFISVYSTRERTFFDACPIPLPKTGITWLWQVISLDGKIYALGGPGKSSCSNESGHKNVYVLDLAGNREWKQCANMLVGRRYFGCGVIRGKIYVFGGLSLEGRPLSLTEVYDPKYNSWSPKKPMIYGQGFHKVETLQEEFLLQGGYEVRRHSSWQIYNPARNEWRVLQPSATVNGSLFTLQGKLYSMVGSGVNVYDIGTNSWKHHKSISWDGIEESNLFSGEPMFISQADNELLAVVRWSPNGFSYESCILQSKGFSETTRLSREIVWQKLPYSRNLFGGPFQIFMGPIQL